MLIDTHDQVLRLRTALRDLVAISAVPAAWVGREPQAIATEFADVLVRALRLDFVFVRLFDPKGSAAVEVMRGSGGREFRQWLQLHLAENGGVARREIIPDAGGDTQSARGIVVPIGVNTEGGLVAAACYRADFPGDIEQLLLSVAANHAATALQNARLIEERRHAEETLQQARDELELKVAERTAELRRTTAELETILDASPVGIALFGSDQTVQRCNPAYERIVGWQADEIVGHPIPISPRYREQWSALAEKLNRGEAFANVEICLRRKDGSDFDASIAFAPFGDDAGGPAGFVGTIEDVTERKQAEHERERLLAEAVAAQQRFRDLVNEIEGIVWEADPFASRFSFVSEQAERILGYPVERWLSEPTFWRDHLYSADREWVVRFCEEATAAGRSHDLEYRFMAADGRVVWIRELVSVTVKEGNVAQLRGVMMDITKQKHAEDAVRQAQADLAYMNRVTTMGELTASLAHEIKQPIAAVATSAGACVRWLAREEPNLEEAREAASRTAQDATRATEIINRIRSLFNKGAPQRELVDINQLINEIVVLLRNETIRYAISVRTELALDLPLVIADRVQLQQVLMNLMINSIEAMKAVERHRELTLSSQRTGVGQLGVSVSDTGVGLPPEGDQVFQAFFTTKPDGTGMGLAISRSIIESHGGRLWATNQPYVGATFHFTLPTTSEG